MVENQQRTGASEGLVMATTMKKPPVRRCLFGKPSREHIDSYLAAQEKRLATQHKDTYGFNFKTEQPENSACARYQWTAIAGDEIPEFYRRGLAPRCKRVAPPTRARSGAAPPSRGVPSPLAWRVRQDQDDEVLKTAREMCTPPPAGGAGTPPTSPTTPSQFTTTRPTTTLLAAPVAAIPQPVTTTITTHVATPPTRVAPPSLLTPPPTPSTPTLAAARHHHTATSPRSTARSTHGSSSHGARRQLNLTPAKQKSVITSKGKILKRKQEAITDYFPGTKKMKTLSLKKFR